MEDIGPVDSKFVDTTRGELDFKDFLVLTRTLREAVSKKDINESCLVIQDYLKITDGGVCDLYPLSDDDWDSRALEYLEEYLIAELEMSDSSNRARADNYRRCQRDDLVVRALVIEATPTDYDTDWGSERQIAAENALYDALSARGLDVDSFCGYRAKHTFEEIADDILQWLAVGRGIDAALRYTAAGPDELEQAQAKLIGY